MPEADYTIKRCSRCGEAKPRTIEYFGKATRNKDGLSGYCRPCKDALKKAWQRDYRAANPERERAYRKKYVPKRNAKQRAYRAANPEQQRGYRKKYIPRSRMTAAAWRAANPEKRRLSLQIDGAKRKARKKAFPNTFTADQWAFCKQYWGYACAVCGKQEGFEWVLAMDHFQPFASPSCIGNIAENIIPLCHGITGCNKAKGSRDPLAWLTEKLGKRKAARKLKEIAAYFALLAPKE